MKKLPKKILIMMLCLVMVVSMCTPAFALDRETLEQYAKKAANVGIQKITDAIPVIGGGVSAVIDTFLPDLLGIKSSHDEVMEKLAEIKSAIDDLGKQMDTNQQALFQQFYKEKIDAFNKDLTVEKNKFSLLSTRIYEIENQYGPEETDDKQYALANQIDDKEVFSLASDLITLTDYLCATQVLFSQDEGIFTLAYKLNCKDSLLGCEAAIKTSGYVNMISSYIESAYTTLFTIALAKLYLYEPLIDQDRDVKLAYENIESAVFSEKNNTSLRAHYNRIFDENKEKSVINTYNDMILDAWFNYIDGTDYSGSIAKISYIPLNPEIGFLVPYNIGYSESIVDNLKHTTYLNYGEAIRNGFKKADKNMLSATHSVLTNDQIDRLMKHFANNPAFETDKEDRSFIRVLDDLGFSFDAYNNYVDSLPEDPDNPGMIGTTYRDPSQPLPTKAEADGMIKVFPMSTDIISGAGMFDQLQWKWVEMLPETSTGWIGDYVKGYLLNASVNEENASSAAVQMAKVCDGTSLDKADKKGDFVYDPNVMLLYFTEPEDAPLIGTLFSKLSPATIVLICIGTAAIIAVPTVVLVRKKKKAAK